MNTSEVQQELTQRIVALNEETFKIERKIKIETRQLNEVKNQKMNEQSTKWDEIRKLKMIDNDLISKKERTKAFNEVIKQLEGVQKEKLKEIEQCEDHMLAVEKTMDNRRENQIKALQLFASGLSEINDKLYYQNIQTLFHSKAPAIVQKHIESVALNALQTIQCPKDKALEQFNANKMKFNYCTGSVQEAMDVDSKTEGEQINKEKVEQMKNEIKNIESEIQTLNQKNSALMSERERFKQKHEGFQKKIQHKQTQLKQQEMKSGTRPISEEIQNRRKECLKSLKWVKEHILSTAEKLVKIVNDSNDPKFAGDQIWPYSETKWSVTQVMQYIHVYQTRYHEYEKESRSIDYDILTKEATSNIQQIQT